MYPCNLTPYFQPNPGQAEYLQSEIGYTFKQQGGFGFGGMNVFSKNYRIFCVQSLHCGRDERVHPLGSMNVQSKFKVIKPDGKVRGSLSH